MISKPCSRGNRPNTSFQRTQARGGRGPDTALRRTGPLNSGALGVF